MCWLQVFKIPSAPLSWERLEMHPALVAICRTPFDVHNPVAVVKLEHAVRWEMQRWWANRLVLVAGDPSTAHRTSSHQHSCTLWSNNIVILGRLWPVSHRRHSRGTNVLWFGCLHSGYLWVYGHAAAAMLCFASPYNNVISLNLSS
jgi:hypothetical protein